MRALLGVANVLLVLGLAPLIEGVIRKVTARIQSRRGPPILQPYLDLLKLLGKEDVESGEIPGMQRAAAALSLASVAAVALLVPMGGAAPLGAKADVIVLVYLLALAGISTLLAGLAAGSPYSMIGVSREMSSMLALEPLLAVALIAGAVQAGSLAPDAVLSGALWDAAHVPVSAVLFLGVTLFAFQGYVGRLPFDVCEAETEIMEGALVEYTGPKLALFRLARSAKIPVYAAILWGLFNPWGRVGLYPVDLAALLALTFGIVLFTTVVAATHARYRIDQALRFYAGLLGVSFAALALAAWGW